MHADNCPVWLGLERLFSPPILLFADSMLLCFYPFAHNLLSSRLKGTTEASGTIQYVLMVPSLDGEISLEIPAQMRLHRAQPWGMSHLISPSLALRGSDPDLVPLPHLIDRDPMRGMGRLADLSVRCSG
jgi:hypothetical protein